jgi:hypothetical protein
MDQANGYVEDLVNCGLLSGKPFVDAFVVGHEVDQTTTTVRGVGETPKIGRIEAVPFGRLIAAANLRLFRLREHVGDRFPESSEGVLDHLRRTTESQQMGLRFRKPSVNADGGSVSAHVAASVTEQPSGLEERSQLSRAPDAAV